ncbi:phage tail protein [Actinophytocola sp.]|uniref:phage tail protein n=1 Tax=Actinophytocola sp. TaxID=1872138 RepID=UPI00389A3295
MTVFGTLPSPYPLIRYLPAVFGEDPFAVRFTAAFDDVLATMVNPIDCVHAYVDPLLAPEPFVDWLASWLGVVLDESWPLSARRAVIAEAVDLFRMRGTMAGLRRHLSVVVAGEVSIVESGGVSVSVRPRPDPPTDVEHWVRVQVRPRYPDAVSEAAVEAVIRAAKPVHVVHSLEVIP